MKPITIAIAGCGSRGKDTYAKYQEQQPDRMKIVAVADIDPDKLQEMKQRYGLDDRQLYPSAEAMLKEERLADVMFICTPDRLHYNIAMDALRKDYHLLLEKPIAPTEQECLDIAHLADERQRHVVVCHVLRYTVFYQKIKELIESGLIGEVISIQAIEKVCYWHQAHSFVRGNWSNAENSTPMILQKCCHDLDILLWLANKKCERVTSFGSLRHFTPAFAPAGAPQRCTDGCPVADRCPYNAERFYLSRLREGDLDWPLNVLNPAPTEENILHALETGPYGRCVYHCDNNVVDHQVVALELQDGLTIDLTMCAFTAEGGRHLRVMGTHGEITGDMHAKLIEVTPFMGEPSVIDVASLSDDFSGHGGGDMHMVDEFFALLSDGAGPDSMSSAVSRSVVSHQAALAAEKSRLSGGMPVMLQVKHQ